LGKSQIKVHQVERQKGWMPVQRNREVQSSKIHQPKSPALQSTPTT